MKEKLTVITTSNLVGKKLIVKYRPNEYFTIVSELLGNRVIAESDNKIEYCFDLSECIF